MISSQVDDNPRSLTSAPQTRITFRVYVSWLRSLSNNIRHRVVMEVFQTICLPAWVWRKGIQCGLGDWLITGCLHYSDLWREMVSCRKWRKYYLPVSQVLASKLATGLISRSDYPLRMDYTLFVKHFPHAAISVYVAYCIKCQRTFGFGSQPPLQR